MLNRSFMGSEMHQENQKSGGKFFSGKGLIGLLGLILLFTWFTKWVGWWPWGATSAVVIQDLAVDPGAKAAAPRNYADLLDRQVEALEKLARHYAGEVKIQPDEAAFLEQEAGISKDALLYCRRIGARRYRTTIGLSYEKWMEILRAGLPQYQELATLIGEVVYKPVEDLTPTDLELMLGNETRANHFFDRLEALRGIPPPLSKDYASRKNYSISEWAIFAYEYN